MKFLFWGKFVHLDGWKTLKLSGGDALLLAFDFTQGRPGASFSDFSLRLDVDAAVLENQVFGSGSSDPARYVDTWVEGLSARGESVIGVVGYCAGAAFAGAVADVLAEQFSIAPRLVLLNPMTVTPSILRGEFVDAVKGLGEGLEEQEVERELAWARELDLPSHADMNAVAEQLLARYSFSVDVVVDRFELDDDVADELSSRFASYLDYLTAASAIPLTSAKARAVVLYDTVYDVEPEFAETAVRIDVGGGHLLDDAGVAALCSALIDTGPHR